jgi:hypothetical protein
MRNIDGDDPKLWAEHTGDLIRVKSEFTGYSVPQDGESPERSYVKDRSRCLAYPGEVLMFLGQTIQTGDWYSYGGADHAAYVTCLVFFSLRSHRKIAVSLKDLNVYRVEEIKDV